MSHTPSLLFPSHLITSSLSTCTPVRPSVLFPSHGGGPCDDPHNVSFGPLAETHSPTSYEPNYLTEVNNAKGYTDILPQTDRDVDFLIQLRAVRLPFLNRIWKMNKNGTCWLHHCTHRTEKQVLTNHEFVTLSEKTQCQVHLTSETVQGNQQQYFHTNESRVKKHFSTEKVFPQGINQFKEKTKLSSIF